jgi:hypothetical protein
MRLSESLNKNIIEVTAGRLLNKFKIKSRRNVLFFEDILANYIKECEKAGYEREMERVAQNWCILTTKQLVPDYIKKLPFSLLFSILKIVWFNLGTIDDLKIVKNNNIVEIKTKNEAITRTIGKNECSKGFYAGILNVLSKSEVECIKAMQTRKSCNYIYEIKDKHFREIKTKEKENYDKLNQLPNIKGITLKDALKANIFQLKNNNKLYFRGKSLWYVENTGFHILGNRKILLERIPHLSYNYFKNIIKKYSTDTEKLTLLKTLLQLMGWGIVKIISQEKKILFELSYLPYGLQMEKDNWNLLISTILGYLWLINKNFEIENIKEHHRKILITYSLSRNKLKSTPIIGTIY